MRSCRVLLLAQLVLLAPIAILFSACAHSPEESVNGRNLTSIVGTVRVVGVEAMSEVHVVTDDDERFVLSGESLPLIRSLSGGRVEVTGSLTDSLTESQEDSGRAAAPAPSHLLVDSFRLLEMNGEPAYLGRLVRRDDGFELELHGSEDSEDALTLSGVPARLQAEVGKIIWVAGPLNGQSLQITSFGIVGG